MDTNVIEATELEMVRASLRHALDTHDPATAVDALLREGWADLCATAPAQALTVLGEEAGSARSAAPVADLATLWGAGLEVDASTAVIHDRVVLAGAGRAEHFVTVAAGAVRVLPASAVHLSPINGIDASMALSEASLDETDGEVLGGEVIGGADEASRALAATRRVLASQLCGAADQMLTKTLAYVLARHQYGRAIGSFQTVKHRLADVKVAVTAARAATRASWESGDTSDHELTAMAAKALAGRAHGLASAHCFQVHGGIAFTVEHGFGQWVRRGLVLDHLLGDHEALTRQVGRQLIASRQVPRRPVLT